MEQISEWHKARGFAGYTWAYNGKTYNIGYCWLILGDGTVVQCRPIDRPPAANGRGLNAGTVAICVTGENEGLLVEGLFKAPAGIQAWNDTQIHALREHYHATQLVLGPLELFGHRDLGRATECPGLNVRELIQ